MTVAGAMVFIARRIGRARTLRAIAAAAPWHEPEAEPGPFPLTPPAQPEPDFTVSLPVDGVVSSRFGARQHPVQHTRRFHRGVDIAARRGAPVWAAAAGTVAFVGMRSGYGLVVIVDHGAGTTTLYAHLDRAYVHAGEVVARGMSIGAVGMTGVSTGAHLHFERRVNGRAVDPGIG